MNRNLHNSMLAFSATGLVLLAGLIVAVPGMQAPQADFVAHAAEADSMAVREAAGHAAEARAAAIEARARAFETRIERSASAAELLAETAAFTARIATETALIAAFKQSADHDAAEAQAAHQKRRQIRRSRAALALPYFSFAQGLRHNRS